ncbi:SGNH/GDSL hydrolase family protein [Pseudarthrobacter sp. R1]|uniref:SGNH/GDSL hydrolase family protein n=1 Tax=Pseudarthrobacter sp. R1 TaxID=2944934 RepID=UPI0021088CF6|nr:SGNH/GDSL hydrolase family protein [Pseudarthrobacter sp. R1]MCQ6272454.1 SGNH/GDSL hydrolase family protein [Pseudarthrobacter sp. R1]
MPVRPRAIGRLSAATAAAAMSVALTVVPAASAPSPTPEPGAKYVALGSSYAAGGGLGSADPTDSGGQCGRTTIAYPYLLADALDLKLTNAACGGASIPNVASTPQRIWSWDGSSRVGELQINAVDLGTDLVTITIGGNDVNYVGNLMAEACLGDLAANPASVISNQLKQYGLCTPLPDSTIDTRLTGITDSLVSMVQAVQEKAPHARVVLVDYLSVLPENGKPCAAVPIPQDRQKFLLHVARELSLATKHAAQQTGAELVTASKESRGHDACSADPWVTGYDFSRGFVMMHPNESGHAAVAEALLEHLTS